MSIPVPKVFRVLLRCDRSAPRLARAAVARIESIDRVRDDALLVTSELVSNAVRHARCGPADEIELMAELQPSALRISVADSGRSGVVPTVSAGGLGLRLVQAIARRWGVDRGPRLRVWAELSV